MASHSILDWRIPWKEEPDGAVREGCTGLDVTAAI